MLSNQSILEVASINEGTSQTHGFKFKTVTFTETKVLGNKQIKTNKSAVRNLFPEREIEVNGVLTKFKADVLYNDIKKGDLVQVMRGKDAGKRGTIESVVISEKGNSVIIKGVNVSKRSQKPNPQFGIQGGIIEIEKPISVSNVMIIDKKTDKPTRVGFRVDQKTGKKERFAKKSGEII